MSVTDAIKEAYAVQPADEMVYETLELDHPAFAAPVRVVTGVEENIDLPVWDEEVGAYVDVEFTAMQVSVVAPGSNEDGPTPMRLRVDNVSAFLIPYLRAATQSTAPVNVTYRAYAASDLSQPGELIDGLELRDVSVTAAAAEASLGFKEIESQNFPLSTYDEEFYPALQSA